jgi:hypothetical protein
MASGVVPQRCEDDENWRMAMLIESIETFLNHIVRISQGWSLNAQIDRE